MHLVLEDHLEPAVVRKQAAHKARKNGSISKIEPKDGSEIQIIEKLYDGEQTDDIQTLFENYKLNQIYLKKVEKNLKKNKKKKLVHQ